VIRAQAYDIGLTTALIAFALFSFQRRSRVLKYVTLAITVAYLGIVKSTMISVTDIFRFVESGRAIMAIPPGEYSMASVGTAFASGFPNLKDSIAWYIFAGFTVVSTVIWGRLYCGRICAFGAFTQLLDVVVPKQIRKDPPAWLERRASLIKYALLVGVLVYYIFTSHTNVYRYVEPFWMYTRTATPLLWGMLAVLLLATLVVRNLYCRFLCPVGAMLGVIAKVTTVLPIKRWSECKTCKICEKACEWGAIQGPKIVKTECVRCDDCERIYRDEKACVHHLMIAKHQKWQQQGIPLKVIS
jgi:NosR/NirI family transcriptional regulator, nitrous oxide reductase regulator